MVTFLVVIIIFASWIILIPNKPKLVSIIFFFFGVTERGFPFIKKRLQKEVKEWEETAVFVTAHVNTKGCNSSLAKFVDYQKEMFDWYFITTIIETEYCVCNLPIAVASWVLCFLSTTFAGFVLAEEKKKKTEKQKEENKE